MAKRDYYEVLGVERTADAEEIKKAYRKLALEVSSGQEPGRQDRRGEVQGTRRGLRNPERPAEARRSTTSTATPRSTAGPAAYGGGGFHDPFEIFREVFGGGGIFEDLFGGGRSDPTQPQRGNDLRYDMEITFEEAAHGCEKEITRHQAGAVRGLPGLGRGSRLPHPDLPEPAAAAARSSIRAAFSASPRPARIARARAACSKSPARPAAARGAASALPRSSCASPPAWTPVRACAPPATAKPASAAARRAICTWCSTLRPMPSSSATATTCFAKCR